MKTIFKNKRYWIKESIDNKLTKEKIYYVGHLLQSDSFATCERLSDAYARASEPLLACEQDQREVKKGVRV